MGKIKRFIATLVPVTFLVATFVIAFSLTKNTTELRSRASVSPYPITGSFIMADLPSLAANTAMFDEMQATGIDTVVFLASGGLGGPCTPNPPAFTESYYFALPEPNWYLHSLKEAKARGMTIFFGLVNVDAYGCMPFWVGSANDTNTYMGRNLDYSARLVNQVKQTVSAQGWSWNDPQFAGFYVFEGGLGNFVDPNSADTQFFKALAAKIKANADGKKILMSPWVLESYTYANAKTAYTNLYNAGIDIIAPQDSMGTLKVTTYAKSAELYRALKDARDSVGGNKQAWANIETQLHASTTSDYDPSTIARVSSQINAAKPYVSKTITWIYQHTMASVPAMDNAPELWTHQYTSAHAAARKKLRSDYLALYNPANTTAATPTPNLSRNTPTPTTPTGRIKEDLNRDGKITIVDYTLFMNGWWAKNGEVDFNGDGNVTVIDYTLFMNAWNSAK
jgi:hypothetical protein